MSYFPKKYYQHTEYAFNGPLLESLCLTEGYVFFRIGNYLGVKKIDAFLALFIQAL